MLIFATKETVSSVNDAKYLQLGNNSPHIGGSRYGNAYLNYISALPCLPISTSAASASIIATSGSVWFEDMRCGSYINVLMGTYELEGNNCLALAKFV